MMSFKKTDGSFVARCDRRRNCDAVELALSSAGMRRVQASGRLTMMPTNAAMQSRRKCQPERARVDRLRRKRGAVSEARLVRRSKAPDARGFGFSRQGGVCLPLDSTRTLNRLESQRSGRRGEARRGTEDARFCPVSLSASLPSHRRSNVRRRTHRKRNARTRRDSRSGRRSRPMDGFKPPRAQPHELPCDRDGGEERLATDGGQDAGAGTTTTPPNGWMDGCLFVCVRGDSAKEEADEESLPDGEWERGPSSLAAPLVLLLVVLHDRTT